jgi:hypothetical protein
MGARKQRLLVTDDKLTRHHGDKAGDWQDANQRPEPERAPDQASEHGEVCRAIHPAMQFASGQGLATGRIEQEQRTAQEERQTDPILGDAEDRGARQEHPQDPLLGKGHSEPSAGNYVLAVGFVHYPTPVGAYQALYLNLSFMFLTSP